MKPQVGQLVWAIHHGYSDGLALWSVLEALPNDKYKLKLVGMSDYTRVEHGYACYPKEPDYSMVLPLAKELGVRIDKPVKGVAHSLTAHYPDGSTTNHQGYAQLYQDLYQLLHRQPELPVGGTVANPNDRGAY